MKVLHISTHNENCGIGKYQEMYIKSLAQVSPDDTHDFFAYSPNVIRKMGKADFAKVLHELNESLSNYDIVHIQHEFSFYIASHLQDIVKAIKVADKPLVATIHTSPRIEVFKGKVISPKRAGRYLQVKYANYNHKQVVMPLSQANLTIVHNHFTQASLVSIGFDLNRTTVLPIPVPDVKLKPGAFREEIAAIDAQLLRQPDDIVMATVGYINNVKGTLQAIKALRLLPDQYKLIIAGGIHPQAHNDEFLDEVGDYLLAHNLRGRVLITGYIEDDDLLNAIVKNADVMIYPYGRSYSSSSAALNNAFAAHKPIVGFPVPAFLEINQQGPFILLCDSFSYFDLAKSVEKLDQKTIASQTAVSRTYAQANSYPVMAKQMTDIYSQFLNKA